MVAKKELPRLIFNFLCLMYVVLILAYAYQPFETRRRYGILFLGLSLLIAYVSHLMASSPSKGKKIIYTLFIVLTLITTTYFWIEYPEIVGIRQGSITLFDFIFGAIIVLLVLETTLREYGKPLVLVITGFIIYGLAGMYFPGILYHPGLTPQRLLMEISCQIKGVYGTLNMIGATYVAVFVVFAGLAQGFGVLDKLMIFIKKLIEKKPYLLPQSGVIASMIFGSFSGSAAANVAGTGSFTIPLNIKYKIPPEIAGAIEAVASSGGQIMPPVMGAAAFIIMEYLNKTYLEIITAGLLGALLFYISFAFSTYFATNQYIKQIKVEHLKINSKKITDSLTILDLLPFPIAIFVLLMCIGVFQLDVLFSGFATVISLLISQFFIYLLNMRYLRGVVKYAKELIKGFNIAALETAKLGIMIASLGIIVEIITTTALSEKLAYSMVELSMGNLLLLLLLVYVTCIVFGMGMSTVAAYLLVVIVAAPALIKFGINPLVAHFFVFYAAILSALTPPVAIACVVAAGIAKTNFLNVAKNAIKLGLAIFILPFLLVFYPELLIWNWQTPITFLALLIGFCFVSFSIHSNRPVYENPIPFRILALIIGFSLLFHRLLLILL